MTQSISQRTNTPNLVEENKYEEEKKYGEEKKYEEEKYDNKIIIAKYKTTRQNVRPRNKQHPDTSHMFSKILYNLNENRGVPPPMNQKF